MKRSYTTYKRIRFGMGVSLEEYCSDNIRLVRTLQSEILALRGYIGRFDTWERTLRVFVFEDAVSRDKAVRTARSIGFSSAGKVDGNIFISNADLERPHLQNYKAKTLFYREYYR